MSEERIYKVYKHTNILNGKIYIGITKQKPEQRWRNGNGYKNGHFKNAIQKYGWGNFKHLVLFDRLTQQEAENIEIELIAYFQSNKREYGYNEQNGGNTTGSHSEETKRKISESNKGKIYSKEVREKISKALKGKMSGKNNPMYGVRLCGELNPNFGKKLSKEIRDKISKNHADVSGKNNPMYDKGKKIIYIELNKIFNSISGASRELKIDRTSISKVCSHKRKSVKGLHFMFLDEYLEKGYNND